MTGIRGMNSGKPPKVDLDKLRKLVGGVPFDVLWATRKLSTCYDYMQYKLNSAVEEGILSKEPAKLIEAKIKIGRAHV